MGVTVNDQLIQNPHIGSQLIATCYLYRAKFSSLLIAIIMPLCRYPLLLLTDYEIPHSEQNILRTVFMHEYVLRYSQEKCRNVL